MIFKMKFIFKSWLPNFSYLLVFSIKKSYISCTVPSAIIPWSLTVCLILVYLISASVRHTPSLIVKAQLFKYLNHFWPARFVEYWGKPPDSSVLEANIKLWKLVNGSYNLANFSGPIICWDSGPCRRSWNRQQRNFCSENGLQQGDILRMVFTTTASLVSNSGNSPAKSKINPFWQGCSSHEY